MEFIVFTYFQTEQAMDLYPFFFFSLSLSAEKRILQKCANEIQLVIWLSTKWRIYQVLNVEVQKLFKILASEIFLRKNYLLARSPNCTCLWWQWALSMVSSLLQWIRMREFVIFGAQSQWKIWQWRRCSNGFADSYVWCSEFTQPKKEKQNYHIWFQIFLHLFFWV